MREILFRGKEDKGLKHEWVYGGIVHQTDYYGKKVNRFFIIDGTTTQDYDIGYEIEVIPETVGQFTGLCDKKGRKIFEGDILKIYKEIDCFGIVYSPPLEYPLNVVVKYDLCAWMWETIGEEKYYIKFPEAWCHYKSEVIGNIFDNHELL